MSIILILLNKKYNDMCQQMYLYLRRRTVEVLEANVCQWTTLDTNFVDDVALHGYMCCYRCPPIEFVLSLYTQLEDK